MLAGSCYRCGVQSWRSILCRALHTYWYRSRSMLHLGCFRYSHGPSTMSSILLMRLTVTFTLRPGDVSDRTPSRS